MKYDLDEFFKTREEFTSNDLVEFTKEDPHTIQGFITVMLNSGTFKLLREETKGIIKKRYFTFGSEEKEKDLVLSEKEEDKVVIPDNLPSEKPEVEWFDEVLR